MGELATKSPNPASGRLLHALLGFILFLSFFQCAVSAPRPQQQHDYYSIGSSIENRDLSNNTLSKRWFIPTPEQADQALVDANFDGNKAIFFSRPASAGAWSRKLGRVLITTAYGNWLNLDNENGPLYKITEDIPEEPIWAVLSAAYARAVPAGATTYVALNPGQIPSISSNWVMYEEPILQQKLCTIFQLDAQDTTAEPVQIFPPPALGAPPPKP